MHINKPKKIVKKNEKELFKQTKNKYKKIISNKKMVSKKKSMNKNIVSKKNINKKTILTKRELNDLKLESLILDFKKKQYGFFEEASIQICEWNKQAIRSNGKKHCYKQDFYGADTLSCHQITPTTFWCNNSCVFCWRPKEYMDSKPDRIVNPEKMIPNLIQERKKLLQGFYGSASKKTVDLALDQKHWAISLSGEPTLYKKLPELILLLKNRPSTETIFLVSNGQNPSVLKKLVEKNALPTQLYISMVSPNEKTFRKITCNIEKTGWKKYDESLSLLKNLSCRTVIRLTLIKGFNDSEEFVKQFSDLLEKTQSDFVEIKSYMWIGLSRQRLNKENMPSHSETKKFSKQLLKLMPSFVFEKEKKDSRIVLLKNKNTKFDTKIINRN